jgi:hypothetical protein
MDDDIETTLSTPFDDWYNELQVTTSDFDVDECIEDDYSEEDYE